ncbi:MAG: alpha/beta hydrolase family protein [Hyphomicrobiales bacterium]|jgi:pimeloyl-ACP methyl ester carboxylesterase|nr:alpha/beta hydrolase family protein [Hyphomicrobiales bacterium]
MAEALVRGVTLKYEVVGASGPWVALTPGSRRSYTEMLPLATRLSQEGFRVLLHDRRNCGGSDVAFDASASEYEIWADDLHELARQLGALPLFVGGASAGARLAMLFGLRHPDAVRGLLLYRVTGGEHAAQSLAETYYGAFVKAARKGGMAAVAESEHFSACIKARPSNETRLLDMDVDAFVHVMEVWQDHFIRAANMPMIGATEEQLRAMKTPICVIAGNDVIHTPATARKLASLVPGAEFHDDVVAKHDEANLLGYWDKEEWKAAEPHMLQIFTKFLARHA